MTELLKGAPVAAEIDARTVELISSSAVTPCLAVLRIGERPDDLSYERSAIKKAAKVGIALKSVVLPSSASQRELMEAIKALNCDDSVHGILMFRPLPGGFDEDEAVMTLSPAKDVDGITPGSMARVYSGSGEGFPPCTAQSVIEILDYSGIETKGRSVAVIGRSLVIGRPVSMLLMQRDATVTICHTKTSDVSGISRRSDIVIAAAGRPESVDGEYLSAGQVVIDVGINWSESKGRIVGDVDPETAERAGVRALAPVPGGVGAVTTSVLMDHTARAALEAKA